MAKKASEERKEREGVENLGFLFRIFRDLGNVWFLTIAFSSLHPAFVSNASFYFRRVWRSERVPAFGF